MPKNSKINCNKSECDNILNKLYSILDINLKNKEINIYHLDNDIGKQQEIIKLYDLCKESYATSSWTYDRYQKEDKSATRPYVLLIRNILSANNINFFNKRTTLTIDGKQIGITKYIII